MTDGQPLNGAAVSRETMAEDRSLLPQLPLRRSLQPSQIEALALVAETLPGVFEIGDDAATVKIRIQRGQLFFETPMPPPSPDYVQAAMLLVGAVAVNSLAQSLDRWGNRAAHENETAPSPAGGTARDGAAPRPNSNGEEA